MNWKLRIFILGICLLGVAAGDKWYDTPFQEWGEKDIDKMLKKSPWAASYTFAPQSSTSPASSGSRGGRGGGGGGGASGASAQQSARVAPAVYIRAQWYSAKPIRMALARQVQLLNPAADVNLIDQFVNTDPEDVILMLGFDSNATGAGQSRMISGIMARETLETLGPVTELVTKNKKQINLKQYVPPNREDPTAKFVFPRLLADGRPLLEMEDKEASFRTVLELRDRKLRLNFRFKTKDMLFAGELTY